MHIFHIVWVSGIFPGFGLQRAISPLNVNNDYTPSKNFPKSSNDELTGKNNFHC